MPRNGVQSAKDKVCSEKSCPTFSRRSVQICKYKIVSWVAERKLTFPSLPTPTWKSCKPNFLLGHWEVGKRKKERMVAIQEVEFPRFIFARRAFARGKRSSPGGGRGIGKQGGDERQQILFRISPELNESSRFRLAESFDRSKFVVKFQLPEQSPDLFNSSISLILQKLVYLIIVDV